MLSTLGMAAISLGLAALSFSQGPVSWIYVLLFLDAVAKVLGRPARFALLPQLVSTEDLPNAVTWRTSLMQLSSVVGPAIGGFVVAGSVPVAYILNTLGSFAFVALLFQVDERRVTSRPGRISWHSVFEGMRFVWDTRLILAMISLDMLAVLLGGAVYLLPIFAEDILRVGPTGFGWLRAAPAAGAFSMALLLAFLAPAKRAGRALLWAMGGSAQPPSSLACRPRCGYLWSRSS